MRVSDVMSSAVSTIESSESAQAALRRMLTRKVRHLPVVDARGVLMGVVTDRDLRHYLFAPGVFKEIGRISADALLRAVTVKQVMSAPAISIDAVEDLEVAARLMVERKIGSLPVVDGGRVIGIVTETDLLRQIVQTEGRTRECEEIVVSFP